MLITRLSPLTRKTNQLELPITEEQYAKFKNGTPIQHAMPHLSDDQREFVLTGMFPGEFEQFVCPEPDDEEEDK